MTDTRGDPRDTEPIDTGMPISVLRELEEPVPRTFMGAVNRRIQRRLLAADMGRFTWSGPILVVLEILGIIFSVVGTREPDEQKE